jgi:hypothetical protein
MTHDLEGVGTLKQIESETKEKGLTPVLAERLKDFAVRLVFDRSPYPVLSGFGIRYYS